VGTASTFATHADAERYTYASLAAHVPKIEAWVRAGTPRKLEIVTHFDHPVGTSVYRKDPGVRVDSWSVKTVLRPDPTMPNGYRIQTSFST